MGDIRGLDGIVQSVKAIKLEWINSYHELGFACAMLLALAGKSELHSKSVSGPSSY